MSRTSFASRILSILVSIVMVVSMTPIALAEEIGDGILPSATDETLAVEPGEASDTSGNDASDNPGDPDTNGAENGLADPAAPEAADEAADSPEQGIGPKTGEPDAGGSAAEATDGEPFAKADQSQISYIDEYGTSYDLAPDEYSLLTSSGGDATIGTSGQRTYYVVEGSVTISGRLTVQGTVCIILCDDAYLNCKKGLIVPQSNTVDIYCQSGKSGRLEAKGDDSAGIGGVEGGIGIATVGTINIHGGNIKATGDDYSAGIGSGDGSYNTSTIYIGGGIVVAQGGELAAGIGGGDDTTAGTVVIAGGEVTATGGENGAGIGGGEWANGGTIKITGGTVTAQGGLFAAGIGGGQGNSDYDADSDGAGGSITITGGTVKATGGKSSAGIGGGEEKNGGKITISGGNITAIGGDYEDLDGAGAGIGGGENGNGGTIIIEGGTIDATGGSGSFNNGSGAGIGGGDDGNGGSITISGGDITVHGGTGKLDDGGAGIGGGNGGDGGTITISGGTILAYGGNASGELIDLGFGSGGAAIGGGEGESGGTIVITGGNIYAQGGQGATGGAAGIGGGDGGNSGNINISLSAEDDVIRAYGSGSKDTEAHAIGAGDGASTVNITLGDLVEAFEIKYDPSSETDKERYEEVTKDNRVAACRSFDEKFRASKVKLAACTHEKIIRYIHVDETGHKRICRYCYVENVDAENPQPHVPDESGHCTLCYEDEGGPVPYFDEKHEEQVCTEYKVLEQSDVDGGLSEGWYYVSDITNTFDKRIVINGDVHLIIRNGSELKALKGIEVPSGSKLTVYGQDGEGYLVAYGGDGNAGIGGNGSAECGRISINGVIAGVLGGDGTAAIGGGKGGTYSRIDINYATITAIGGDGGAGIGGGQHDSAYSVNEGNIRITESKISAQGGMGGAGIGGGYQQNCGSIMIYGAPFDGSAGDPTKQVLDPDAIVIKAVGGKNKEGGGGGAGIGGGESGHGGVVTIEGGKVYAIGGDSDSASGSGGAAGIGGGDEGDGGSTYILDGIVVANGGSITSSWNVLHQGGGAGIGGGNNGDGDSVMIAGGYVWACGGTTEKRGGGGAGIGGGDNGDSGAISINGGQVYAKSYGSSAKAAGIGSGNGGKFEIVTINGGYVDAIGWKSSCIGSSDTGDGDKSKIHLADDRCVIWKGFDETSHIEKGSREWACYQDKEVIVEKCNHPASYWKIEDPANSGHRFICGYCKIYKSGWQLDHELDDDAVCICGYHGVIVQFDAGEAGSDAGTMANAVVLGDTDYALPTCGFTAPEHCEFAGWLIGETTYEAGDSYTTPETRDETVTVTATAQWSKAGHNWGDWSEWSTSGGSVHRERTCKICGEVEAYDYQDGHVHDPGFVPGVDATCTKTGIKEHFQCIDCGKLYDSMNCDNEITEADTVIAALDHDWGEWTQTKAATCTEKGQEKRICSRNDLHRETRDVEALGHTEVVDDAIAPTCTEPGKAEGAHCSVCGEVLVAQEEIPAKGHVPGDPVKENETAAGYDEVVYCTACKAELSRSYVANKGILTFNLDGGTLDGQSGTITVEANVGDTINLPGAPTKDGFTFKFWRGSEYAAGAEYTVEGDHEFTAEWEKNAEPDPSGGGDGGSSDSGGKSGGKSAVPGTGDDAGMLAIPLSVAAGIALIVLIVSLVRRRKA